MAKKTAKNPADYITSLHMNGLNGRMLRLPALQGRQREILMVYGLHASLERMLGFAEDLNQYGAITIPDLPGFGGMDSFYTIGETPTLDNMADYLASFIRLRYRRKRVTIMGMSYGFLVVTRMLQKYPDIAKKTDLLVSLVGFVHHDDFKMKKLNFMFIDLSARIGRRRLPAWIIKTFIFRGPVLRLSYKLVAKKHRKLQSADPAEIKRRVDFEIMLWKINDARTRAKVSYDAFRVNLCNQQVDLPVYHVAIADDHFFDNHIVEQHMRIIYKGFERIDAVIDGKHAPTVIADAKTAAPYVPKKLRRLLTKQK